MSRPNRLFVLGLLLVAFASSAQAVQLTHGPVMGAVTDHSVRIYVRADGPTTYRLDLQRMNDATGRTEGVVFTRRVASRDSLDHSQIVYFSGLLGNTRYRVWVSLGNAMLPVADGSFRTFPQPGQPQPFTFVTGSCQETDNMKVFNVIPEHEPLFLLHTGDYTYPDYQIAPDYAADYGQVAYSYRKRYEEKEMESLLHHLPIDYIYDDNDYVGGGAGRYCKNFNHRHPRGQRPRTTFESDTFPPRWRRNVIKGYNDFFPAYPQPDTSEGVYHAFTCGNAEFLFLDRCSARPYPNAYAFHWTGRRWAWRPQPEDLLLGRKQLDWLKKRLRNSTADWKFIVAGVPLNKNMRKPLETGVKLQKLSAGGYNAFHMSTGFSNYFGGHPWELYEILDWIYSENIENVIVISGDTHHNVMDDGRNAGLPEMNASGLSVAGTHLAKYMKLVGRAFFQFNYQKGVWNQGGGGLRPNRGNHKNAFGKVHVHGTDYVELSLVDEDNHTLSSFRVYHHTHEKHLDLEPYWNEAKKNFFKGKAFRQLKD